METSGVAVVVGSWRLLAGDERETAYQELTRLREQDLAGNESSGAVLLRSLRTVAEFVGHEPSVDEYKEARSQLAEQGVTIEPFHRLVTHFGTWVLAKEALALSEITTVRRVEARFRSRKLGKVWRYTEQTLEETFRRCMADIGRAPTVAEFEFWRDREIELAKARGEDLHLPGPHPSASASGTGSRLSLITV